MIPLKRHVEAAKRYAAADRSDPFAFDRAMTHLENVVASMRTLNPIIEAIYDAASTSERRSYEANGKVVEYTVPAYINITRP